MSAINQILHSALLALQGGAIKERVDALSTLKEYLSSDEAVLKIGQDEGDVEWSTIFDAIINSFQKEKILASKKGTASPLQARKRMESLAQFVRTLVEKGVSKIPQKTAERMIEAMHSNMIVGGELLDDVSVLFLKTIENLLNWRPNSNHLSNNTWLKLVNFGFNAVLNDAFGTQLMDEEPDPDATQSSFDADSMFIDHGAGVSRKRLREQDHTPRSSQPRSYSITNSPSTTVQIAAMSLLRRLLTSPVALLLSPTHPQLPTAILNRMERILSMGISSTMHFDYLVALSTILSQYSLNKLDLVVKFANAAWPDLVSLWGTKEQNLKEQLTIIFKILLPYYTLGTDAASFNVEGIASLWEAIDKTEIKVDRLSQDSLRFHLLPESEVSPFRTCTFQHGYHFDDKHALSWTILELQADCTQKLYLYSESPRTMTDPPAKRTRIAEKHVSIIVRKIEGSHGKIRVSYLQLLLFLIDRHWSSLHHELQTEIMSALSGFLAASDTSVQYWCFICFAALAHACTTQVAEGAVPSPPSSSSEADLWDRVWTCTMRCANLPAVSRAACHVAQVVLYHAKSLLSPKSTLAEVEAFAKNLGIQGPPFPYDSVCALIVRCMRVASQDIRLHRMAFEDKALSWLTDSWRPGSASGRTLPLHTVGDIFILISGIRGHSNHTRLICELQLPDAPIVNAKEEEHATTVIRDFVLYARLPTFKTHGSRDEDSTGLDISNATSWAQPDSKLAEPHERERRISSYFLKTLDGLLESWKFPSETFGHYSADAVRTGLDFTVSALVFEASLLVSGKKSDWKVTEAACRLLTTLTPQMKDPQWTVPERIMIVAALEPLIYAERPAPDLTPWDTLLPPTQGSGLRTEVLRSLTGDLNVEERRHTSACRAIQRAIFQDPHVPIAIAEVLKTAHACLRLIRDDGSLHESNAMDIDDLDFGGVEHTNKSQLLGYAGKTPGIRFAKRLVNTWVSCLAVFSVLQSPSGEATRDRELQNLVMHSSTETTLLLGPSFLRNIQRGTLHISTTALLALFKTCIEILHKMHNVRDPRVFMFVIHLMRSLMRQWVDESARELVAPRSQILGWILKIHNSNAALLNVWSVRDCFTQFLEQIVLQAADFEPWSTGTAQADIQDPAHILATMAKDPDIRVRIRAAVSNARILRVADDLGIAEKTLYDNFRDNLTKTLLDYEDMLTRFICLGNAMIVCGNIRRGPYWHLLETCFHSSSYNAHIETILRGVATRLGLPSLTAFFELYARQMAYSMRLHNYDFLLFPKELLGYKDRLQCSKAAFTTFAPMNLAGIASDTDRGVKGRRLFRSHCNVIGKAEADGLAECFAESIGYIIVANLDNTPNGREAARLPELIERFVTLFDVTKQDLDSLLRLEVVGIVVAILSTLDDSDASSKGSVMRALSDSSPVAAQQYSSLTTHISAQPPKPCEFNLPCASASTVLQALDRFHNEISIHLDPAVTYHVLHILFAELERNPLVNEQLRLLNAIFLWIACHHEQFNDRTPQGTRLLRTLTQAAANLLSQFDLIRGAQSLLQWTLSRMKRDTELPELLLRVASAAYDWSMNPVEVFAVAGNDVLQWIEAQACGLSNKFPKSVRKALAAWPKDLSTVSQELATHPTCEQLSAILAERQISSNRFRLVRQLRQLAADGTYDTSRFAKSDFWRLKDFIPVSQQLFTSEISSFAQLLVLHRGAVDGLECEHDPQQNILEMHLREAQRSSNQKTASFKVTSERVIMAALLKTLSAPSTTRVYLAFVTLRLILGIQQPRPGGTPSWESSDDTELLLLQAYPTFSSAAKDRIDLEGALSLEAHPNLANDYKSWIRLITSTLADFLATNDSFYGSLTSILQADTEFAEEILPILVYTLLRSEDGQRIRSHQLSLSRYFSEVLRCETSSTSSRRAIINTVLHLRHFCPTKTNNSNPLGYDLWLSIDFVLLSRNAIMCGAYTTALLCLELATEHAMTDTKEQSAVEQVLYDIYDRIDEPDGFYGIQTQDQQQFLLRSFHHEKQWDKAFQFHGAAVEATDVASRDAQGLLQAMHSFGFDRLAMTTMHNMTSQDQSDTSSMTYSLGWRNEMWDLPDHTGPRTAGTSLYLALQTLNRERNPISIAHGIERALHAEMQTLRATGNENLVEIRTVTQSLMCLEQVRQWRTDAVQLGLKSESFSNAYKKVFGMIDSQMEFSDFEAIMATRLSLLRSARHQGQFETIGDLRIPLKDELINLEVMNLVTLSEAARQAGRAQIALNAVVHAQKLHREGLNFEVSHEFARVLWMMNEPMPAMHFLSLARKSLGTKNEMPPDEMGRKALVYALQGSWASQACLEKPESIQTRYFDPAAELLERLKKKNGKRSETASVYHDYAIFAERQYHAIAKAPDLLRLKILIDRKRLELEHYTHMDEKERKSSFGRTKKILEIDQAEYDAHIRARDVFLDRSIEMYSRSLESSDEFDDDSTIRLCSLWFANFEHVTCEFPKKVATAVNRVPTRKFVFLTHQLSAHLSKRSPGQTDSSQVVLGLVKRMCFDHPFHCLYSVYCLQAEAPFVDQTERERAAATLLDQLSNSNDKRTVDRVNNIRRLCTACVDWARVPFQKVDEQKPVPPDQGLASLKDVPIPPLTAHVALKHDRQYDHCVSIERYALKFELAGGNNKPKIMTCIASDGRRYKQLFKGGADDLRQDAVMEQVFELVNVVLRRDRDTLRRDLHLLTYKVIPLASRVGVIEWVEDTTPLSEWLKTAHKTYAPSTPNKYDSWAKVNSAFASLELNENLSHKRRDKAKIHVFTELQSFWKPVMRHYFTEQHKEPMSWFRMRLHYARSVAATSIVGHLLGLGDRHLSNILIHRTTGEMVHIDLGIAFEQGKLLPMPERVPFRLTADMVDGLGTSGTKGVFQRCAEQTLRVLRDGSEVIMTVLDVLKYDPLYTWTANEEKLKKVQSAVLSEQAQNTDNLEGEALRFVVGLDRSAGHADEAADRALSTVARKLDKGLSVQFMVNELIAEATDPSNLGRMYSGWTSWC